VIRNEISGSQDPPKFHICKTQKETTSSKSHGRMGDDGFLEMKHSERNPDMKNSE
jgi:hypothetical protein